jgi:large subunit ribosomal protein L32e
MGEKNDLDRLLELRRRLKEKKPVFLRHLWWKKAKFRNNPRWRKPKGIDNKMRLKLKGYPPLVEIGYRGPRKVRGLHPSGLTPVVVHSPDQLDTLDPKTTIIYIGRSVGLRKRIIIMEKAVEKGFKVANPIPLPTQTVGEAGEE